MRLNTSRKPKYTYTCGHEHKHTSITDSCKILTDCLVPEWKSDMPKDHPTTVSLFINTVCSLNQSLVATALVIFK